MSEGSMLWLDGKGLNDKDFRQILTKLSSPHRREQLPRKCKRQRHEQGEVAEILANLPTNVSGLDVSYNEGNAFAFDSGYCYVSVPQLLRP
jgi:hypothetical protein